MVFDFTKTRTEAIARQNVLLARLQDIVKEKTRLDEETQQVQVELTALDQILEGTSYMEAGGPPPDLESLGFRGQIEKILDQNWPSYLLPTEIREKLRANGVTGSTPRNLLISIHTVLDRLDKEKLIDQEEQPNGRKAYRRKKSIPGLILETFTELSRAGAAASNAKNAPKPKHPPTLHPLAT